MKFLWYYLSAAFGFCFGILIASLLQRVKITDLYDEIERLKKANKWKKHINTPWG